MRNDDRFTERARNVLNLAHEKAAELGHGYVGSEHILLGIVCDGGGAAARILRDNGVDEELVRLSIEKLVGRGESADTTVQGLTPMAKTVIELAVRDAMRLGHTYVGTEHLLMGILREGDSVRKRKSRRHRRIIARELRHIQAVRHKKGRNSNFIVVQNRVFSDEGVRERVHIDREAVARQRRDRGDRDQKSGRDVGDGRK